MRGTRRVSVCVPTYNRSRFLGECLESILRQSFADYELVILDNCSTDDTEAVVRKFRDPRIRYLRNSENVGQIGNLNRCVEVAEGEFICVFHDDDVYDPLILEKELEVFSRHQRVGLTHTAVWLLTEEGLIRKLHQVSKRDYIRAGHEAFLNYLQCAHDIVFSTVMVRRECYERVGMFAPKYQCADFDMWLRIALRYDIAYIAEPLAGYRIHQGTASQAMRAVQWQKEYFEIFEKALREARGKIVGLEGMEADLRRRAARSQARRNRVEAAARIAGGDYERALEYLKASSRMDPSLVGRLSGLGLSALRNPPGRVVLEALRAVRYGLPAVMNGGMPGRGRRYFEVSSRKGILSEAVD